MKCEKKLLLFSIFGSVIDISVSNFLVLIWSWIYFSCCALIRVKIHSVSDQYSFSQRNKFKLVSHSHISGTNYSLLYNELGTDFFRVKMSWKCCRWRDWHVRKLRRTESGLQHGFCFDFMLHVSLINVLLIMMQMEIFIMAQNGNKIHLEVKSSDTILSVKERIVDKQDFQVHQQNLLFGGRSLQDSMTLADYNIEDESTLDVFLRLMGD